jgi:hypothetical protein
MRAFNVQVSLHAAPFLVSALLLPSFALAENLGVLAVAPPPGPGPDLVEQTVQLRQAMAERDPGVLDASQLRERMSGQLPGASLVELDRAYEGARAAYVAGDYEGSVRTLHAIIEDLEKLPDGPEAFKQWMRATLRLAKVDGDLGHEDAAKGDIDRLVRAEPEVQVDRSLYPPKFVRQVEDAKAELKALPKKKLSITASEKNVRVYLNGRDLGLAPVGLLLARGRYRVSGALGDLRAPPLRVDVGDEDQTILLDFAIPQALRPNEGPGLVLPEANRQGRIIAAGGFLGLDSVLAVSVIDQGGASQLSASLFDVRRGMLTREGRVRLSSNRSVPVGGIHALADFLQTGRASPEVVAVQGIAPTKTPDLTPQPPAGTIDLRPQEARPPGKSNTLGWLAIGSGVAALGCAGLGIAEAMSASSSYDSARKLLVNGNVTSAANRTSYNQQVSSGDSAKSVATIGYVGAGALLITSGVLGYLAYKQTGEVGPFRF